MQNDQMQGIIPDNLDGADKRLAEEQNRGDR